MKINFKWLDESDAWRHAQILFVLFGKRPAQDYAVSDVVAGWLEIWSNEFGPKQKHIPTTHVLVASMLDSRVIGYNVHLTLIGQKEPVIFKCRNKKQTAILNACLTKWLIRPDELDQDYVIKQQPCKIVRR
jgi:hypothetical protein